MVKKKWIIIFILLLSPIALFTFNSFQFIHDFNIEGNNWKIFELKNLSESRIGDKVLFYLNEMSVTNPSKLDLYIGFEERIKDFQNYRVIYSDLEYNSFENVNGVRSGKFYFSDNYISLLPKTTSIFSPGIVSGSFTIEFWIYLYQNFDHQTVIRYIGNNLSDARDRLKYGFEIYIKDDKLIYNFQNFFWSIENEPYSIEIEENDELELYKWEHHAISFNIMNGKIATYKNGIEQEVKWVTTDGKFLSPINNPMIKEELSAPLIIGQNAFFSLDELKVSRDTFSDFYLQRYNNSPAELITDVYKFSENIAQLKQLEFGFNVADYTFVKLAYRISDEYFLPDNNILNWVYVQNNVNDFPYEHSAGKYIQYKVMIYPFEEVTGKISIDSIKLKYSIDRSPDFPILLSAVPGDEKVTITWIPSTEPDILGYEIYYGNRQNDYICDQSLSGISPIFVPYRQEGELSPLKFTLIGLNNETPYFISIRTIDANSNRSPYSQEYYARPSTVYNDSRYSVDR